MYRNIALYPVNQLAGASDSSNGCGVNHGLCVCTLSWFPVCVVQGSVGARKAGVSPQLPVGKLLLARTLRAPSA